jgi:hypothetical protein
LDRDNSSMSRILRPGADGYSYDCDGDSMDTISRNAHLNGMAQHWPDHFDGPLPDLPHNKRVGSAELEQLIKTLDEEDKHQSKSLSITPSWNFAADGTPLDRDSAAFRNLIRDSNITQDYAGSANRRNSTTSNTSKRLSYTLPTLQSNDFEQVNTHRPSTRPPPPLALESPSRNHQPIIERKFSWAAANSANTTNEAPLQRGNTTPSRSMPENSHASVSPKLSSLFFYRDNEKTSEGESHVQEDKENSAGAGEYFSTIYKVSKYNLTR